MDPRPAPSVSVPATLADERTPVDGAARTTDRSGGGAAPPDPAGGGWPRAFGAYELLGEVARGGMGVVYRARQRGLDRVVALKMVLGAELGTTAGRFIQEAQAAAALDHPNVVAVHDAGEVGGRVYFAMALVDGPDLAGHLKAHGVPPLADALHLFVQVVEGVAHAHRAGIVHRDLKPANILIDRDGRPRVTDFGLAKRAAAGLELTQTGQAMGTPAYMPPEQARDAREAGPAADVYALGAVLYFLLTGRPPFEAESLPALLLKVMLDPPPAPRSRAPHVPPVVDELCARCLAKDPADRFPDAQALLDALLPIAEPYLPRRSGSRPWPALRAAVAPPPGLTPTLPHESAAPAAPPVRRKRWAWVAAAALVGLVAAVLLGLRPWADPEGPPSVIWPPVGEIDFALTVEFVGKTEQDGAVILVPAGTPLQFRIKAEKACYVAVYSLDADGVVNRLFPVEGDKVEMLTAGTEQLVPPGADEIGTVLTRAGGTDRLRVFACSKQLPTASGKVDGRGLMVFETLAERQAVAAAARRFASLPRGLVRKRDGGPEVSEAELLFRVVPKKK